MNSLPQKWLICSFVFFNLATLPSNGLTEEPAGLSFWYYGDTWPFCTAKTEDCATFGFEYVESNKDKCWLGTSVMCKVKDDEVTPQFSPKGELNVMSYNIHEMPYLVATMGQRERTCRIPRELHRQLPELDIVMVQELFMEGCMKNLDFRTLMSHYGWKYSTDTLQGESVISGGVAIFSKYPLRDTKYKVFTTKSDSELDRFSPKGFVYTTFRKDGKLHHLINTHFQANDGKRLDQVRLAQGREMADILNTMNLKLDEPVILGGDLNFNYWNHTEMVERLFNIMNFNMIPLNSSIPMTFDPDINNVVSMFEDRAWYDYIGVRKGNLQPKEGVVEAIQLRSEESFRVCRKPSKIPFYIGAESILCFAELHVKDLSDHFPVISRLKF